MGNDVVVVPTLDVDDLTAFDGTWFQKVDVDAEGLNNMAISDFTIADLDLHVLVSTQDVVDAFTLNQDGRVVVNVFLTTGEP